MKRRERKKGKVVSWGKTGRRNQTNHNLYGKHKEGLCNHPCGGVGGVGETKTAWKETLGREGLLRE